MSQDKKKKAKFFDPDTRIKDKVGTAAPFKKERVNQAQGYIEKNEIDFAPMAKKLLDEMREKLNNAHKGELSQKELVEQLTQPVMQLKANAATFKYPIITVLMNTFLNFLETLDSLNKDAIEISEVNYTTVRAVLAHKIKDPDDKRGRLFVKELQGAIQRYYKKHGP